MFVLWLVEATALLIWNRSMRNSTRSRSIEIKFGDFDLPRYGAINLRSSIRNVQDILWKLMDESTETGFRPDELIALFGGFSAGAYGTHYNYPWVLDDLQWPRTAAFPDAGGALDNGTPAGISSLAPIKIPAWGVQPYLPPYCVKKLVVYPLD